MNWKRTFSPQTNPALYSALLGLAYAVWQAELAATAHGPLTWTRASHIAAGAAWAFVSAWVRGKVTPVADPKDGNGKPLVAWTKALSDAPPDRPPAGTTP